MRSEICQLDEAIEGGVRFLRQRQKPDGSFSVYYSLDHTFECGCTDDLTLFGAAMVAHCLGHVDSTEAQTIIDRSVALFLNEMRSGVWRYWIRRHPYYKNIPPDVDTTSCVSIVLKRQGVHFPDNRAVLELNRDGSGMFFTWIKPRVRMTLNPMYWGIIFPQIIKPIRSLLYWRVFNARPSDKDGLINANVLMYLGVNTFTFPIAEFLCDSLAKGEEETCDKWYRNALLFYYFTSRALCSLLAEKDDVSATIVERTIGKLRAESAPLNLAFGICALITCGADAPELSEAVQHLLDIQDRDGSWAACPMYYDGPRRLGAFGSEELTTGFCLEALARYRALRRRNLPSAP